MNETLQTTQPPAGTAPLDELDLNSDVPPPSPKKQRHFPWFLVASIVLILLGGYYFLRRNEATSAALTYKAVAVARGNVLQTVTANGQITPIKSVTVGSQVSGIITALTVDFNSTVTNGQLVAQIDPSTYQQLLVQAEADDANARAALSLAQLTYNRDRELFEGHALPKADLESAQAALQQAEATVKSKSAALKKAQVDLERTTIYSPIDGTVISRAVDIGQTVAATMTTPTLFTIAQDLRQMNIDAAVSEADIGGVAEGQVVQFTVDAYPNRVFEGRITQVRFEASTNQNVVCYSTIVEVQNQDLKLRPSMTANATIITADRKNVLRIPNAALRFKPADAASAPASNGLGTKTIYVLEAGASGAPSLKPVEIKAGVGDGSWTEVLEGLKEGDQVVTGIQVASDIAAKSSGSNPFGGMGSPPR